MSTTEGTRVTCEDIATGETESVVLKDNYVVVTSGNHYVSSTQRYGNGTTVVTIKREVSR